MYQCSSCYPDPFLHSLSCAFASPSPPPPHHHDPHTCSHHLIYPPSPQQGTSPPSEGGGFLGLPTSCSPPLPSSYLQSSSSSSSGNSALPLHGHLLDRSHHCSGGGGSSSVNSPHLYDRPDFFDFPSSMQGMNSHRPLPDTENCTQEVGGGGGAATAAAMAGGRVARYSAEERKERIERYRSKRNQRNFQKKITYVCRKTLADSRPRVRGRFARNGEAEQEADTEVEAGELSSCNNSSSQGGAEWLGWRPGAEEEDEYGCDPGFWASFLDSLSMNNPIS